VCTKVCPRKGARGGSHGAAYYSCSEFADTCWKPYDKAHYSACGGADTRSCKSADYSAAHRTDCAAEERNTYSRSGN